MTRTDPEAAQVGGTLEQAQRLHGDRARARWWVDEDLDRDALGDQADGFCHLVVGPGGQLLGATVVSPRVRKWIGELAAAVRQGLSVPELARALPGYPTYADGWPRVAGDVDDDLGAPLPARLVDASDGAARAMTLGLLDWPDTLHLLGSRGPTALIARVRQAERQDPSAVRWPRNKQSDDATAVYVDGFSPS